MTDARPGDRAPTTSDSAVPRWVPVLLLAVGVLMVLGGVIGGLAAKASADHTSSSFMPTLPVYTFSQFTQGSFVPDYAGLWIGFLVAGVGLVFVAASVIVATTRRRAA